jgi:multicomponent Na+:H+ antiporter subunit E
VKGFPVLRVVATTLILSATWYAFSGIFDLLHFGTGVITAIVIALNMPGWPDGTRIRPLRLVAYLPWLVGQIVISNLRVARTVLKPRMTITPSFVSRPPGVPGDRAMTTLAASTTLTPGTLTIEIGPDEIFVHALDQASAQDVRDGVMAERVAGVYEVTDS